MTNHCTKCGRLTGKKEHVCSGTSWNKGKPWSVEMKLKMSESQKKITTARRFQKGNKEFLGKHHTEETKEKQRQAKMGNQHTLGFKHSIETRRKLSENHKGEKSYLWKGGISSRNLLIRGSLDYRLWREAVFKRDNFICQMCTTQGGKLNADHIKPFSLFPELRFAIDNGRTLCVPCHRKTPTFALRVLSLTREDFA